MKVVEYGKGNKDIIILLHGGGLSWWNYEEVAENSRHYVPCSFGNSELRDILVVIYANGIFIFY